MKRPANPHRSLRPGWRLSSLLLGLVAATIAAHAADTRGLPFIRTYPLDEIGSVPRNLRLSFDAFGRIAVMYDGVYSVLNDTTWVDRMDADPATKIRMTTIRVANGTYYYGGRGSWGTVELTPQGRFRARPLVPPDAPAWTSVTAFNQLLVARLGVYFYDYKGVVYWDFARRQNAFFEIPRVASLFPVGDRMFVSAEDGLLREITPGAGTIRIADIPGLHGASIEAAAPLDGGHALLAVTGAGLLIFDGATVRPWGRPARQDFAGRVSLIERLVDGGVAVAVNGRGVFLFSADGELRWAFTAPEFQRVGALAAGEPGVLWVAEENAVQRIFYDSPLTNFGQPLGLTVVWPHLAFAGGQVLVCSNGSLSESMPPEAGHPARFRAVAGAPALGADAVAANGPRVLVGNSAGVFARTPDGRYAPVIAMERVAGLAFLDPDTCVAIGSKEIAALRWTDGWWQECAPRIGGVGDVPIRAMLARALWIEMGADRVARLTLREGRLDLQYLSLPWSGSQWTNTGAVGDTIVLSAAAGQRTFYDDLHERPCAAPELDALLARSPYWIARVITDRSGTLWATHAQGLVTYTPVGDGHRLDAVTYELRNDSYPDVFVRPDNDVWVTTGRSLYHVERAARPPRPDVELVSVFADNLQQELLPEHGRPTLPPALQLDDTSLSFRLFSGTYAWRHPPIYEYRLNPREPWTPVDPSLLLHFPNLRDDAYRLEVRSAVHDEARPPGVALDFTIKPPWFRTPASYAGLGLLAAALVTLIVRQSNHRSRQRNEALERVVRERTKELERTMARLNDETRNSAVLSERSRLAGEFHDSVQQGLSGSILQLDATLEQPAIPHDVRSRLDVVRSMLSYTREEVQQAVWNLTSPLLQNGNFGEALRKLAGYIHTGSAVLNLSVPSGPVPLEPAARQNLLRIAQEAITNAVKHSSAARIDVTLQARPDVVTLTVVDNGVGFDPVVTSKVDGHFGLRGLQGRARSIKADLKIYSAPGHGTLVEVIVPANREPNA